MLPLGEDTGGVIEMARGSASNNRMIIYGLGGTAQDAMRHSKLCINAVFHEPLERSAAIKLVRSTRGLVLQEFRRYTRIPVMTEVGLVLADGTRMTATSQETQFRRNVTQGQPCSGAGHAGRSVFRVTHAAAHLDARAGDVEEAQQNVRRPF